MDTNEYGSVPVGPFTDFGQFGRGRIDLRVFLQSDYWVDEDGTGHALTAMSDESFGFLLQTAAPLLYLKDPYEFIESTVLVTRLRALTPDAPELGDLLLQELQRTDGE
jgi:hypothetical protein